MTDLFGKELLDNTKMRAFLDDLSVLCKRYKISVVNEISLSIEPPMVNWSMDFAGMAHELLSKIDINKLKSTTMAKKIVKFTNKETNDVFNMLIGKVGENVYKLTHNVNEMNDAIRWCNRHDIGETLDAEKYSITLEEEHPVQ